LKANRSARRSLAGLHHDERGASEIVGYMIAFLMGSLILVMSLTGFNMMRDYSGDLLADRTVSEMAHRVTFAVEEALQAGSQFPESEFSRTIRLPKDINGHTFTVDLGPANVWVNLTNPGPHIKDENGNDLETMGRANVTITRRAGADVLCGTSGVDSLDVSCNSFSSDGEVVIRYGLPSLRPGEPEPDKPIKPGVYFIRP
jgi:hypothetical protein